VPVPSYPLLEHLAELESVQLAPYRLAYDGAWHIDLESLTRAVTPRTRAVIVVSPNNPTGQYVSVVEQAALARLGLPVISDEVFFEYPLVDAPRAAAPPDVLRFSLGGLSKLAAAPQLKLAWTVLTGPASARSEARARLELIADTFLSVGAPVQLALPEILTAASERTHAVRARCRGNLAQLRQALDGSSLTPLLVEGGWSAIVRLPNLTSEDELVSGLLREHGVLVQPGWFYDFESAPFVILSLLTEPSSFAAGVAGLLHYVTRLER
jgi:aspartate/methionine/tyrosine aminotransferase